MEYIGHLRYDQKLISSKKIVICGAGKKLDAVMHYLTEKGKADDIVAIADKYINAPNTMYKGIPIVDYYDSVMQNPDAVYIVYNRFSKEILVELNTLKIKNIHLIRGVE